MTSTSAKGLSPAQPTGSGPLEESASTQGRRITLRALVLGVLTIAAMFYFVIQIAQRQGSGTYVPAQYPIAAFMPFALWLVASVALKTFAPRISLTSGELLSQLLTVFSLAKGYQKGSTQCHLRSRPSL